jgi:hypothetical protein
MNELQGLVEIRLKQPVDFLKVKETLTRIGVGDDQVLHQACHILHKRGRYYIIHYKELMLLDGDDVEMTDIETARRNTIAFLLNKWGLCEVVDTDLIRERLSHDQITIVPFKEKNDWKLVSSYTVGKKKNPRED